MMKKKFKIFLGDLNYINEISKFNLYVPLNIGYIASYLKRKYGQEVEIVLFKDPSKFLDQTIKEKPDQDIYIKAMDYITPRTQTLYNLYYE